MHYLPVNNAKVSLENQYPISCLRDTKIMVILLIFAHRMRKRHYVQRYIS